MNYYTVAGPGRARLGGAGHGRAWLGTARTAGHKCPALYSNSEQYEVSYSAGQGWARLGWAWLGEAWQGKDTQGSNALCITHKKVD